MNPEKLYSIGGLHIIEHFLEDIFDIPEDNNNEEGKVEEKLSRDKRHVAEIIKHGVHSVDDLVHETLEGAVNITREKVYDVKDLLELPIHLIKGGLHIIEHFLEDIFDIPEDNNDEDGSHKVKRDLGVAAKAVEKVGTAVGGYIIPLGVDGIHIGEDVGTFVGDAVKPVKKGLDKVFDKKKGFGEAVLDGAKKLFEGTVGAVAKTVIEKVTKRDVSEQIPDDISEKEAELTDNGGRTEIIGVFLKKTKVQGLQKCISEIMRKMILMRYDDVKGDNALTDSYEEDNWDSLTDRIQECFITMRYF